MSFSAKLFEYCPRPSFSSQSETCCIAAAPRIGLHPPASQEYSTNPQQSSRTAVGPTQHLASGSQPPLPRLATPRSDPQVVLAEAAPAALAGAHKPVWLSR